MSMMHYPLKGTITELSQVWKKRESTLSDIAYYGYFGGSHYGDGQIYWYANDGLKIPGCIIEGFANYHSSGLTINSSPIVRMNVEELCSLIGNCIRFFKAVHNT
jgi:hypothetical protein